MKKNKNFPARLKFFKNWTSGNEEIDQFIRKHQLGATDKYKELEWVPYEQFTKIEHIADGGFGKVYKAKWDNKEIVLKSLTNSQANTDFLKEIANHKLFGSNRIVNCLGVSRDPVSKDYLMVMDYIKDGDLRKFLQSNQLNFKDKLGQLWRIAEGLKEIHKQKLVHHDFHSGNILNKKRPSDVQCYITDLGLCRPANSANDSKVYGVLPYVAPEVLNGKAYTQATDIYSWGIVAAETLSGLPPYHDVAHDEPLALWICQGVRPNLDNVKVPQLLKDLIKQCWDADPKQRPTAVILVKTLSRWRKEIKDKKDNEFTRQAQIAEELNETLTKKPLDYKLHPSAVYTSRLLDFRNLPQPQNSQAINDQFHGSKDLDLDINNFLDSQEISQAESSIQVNSTDLNYNNTKTDQELASRTKRQLSLESQTETNQGEAKLIKTAERIYQEPMAIDNNWQNIHPSFTPQLTQAWTNHHFTPTQAQDWINTNPPAQQEQARQEPAFYAWLRDTKNLTPEQVLNHSDLNALRQEYQTTQQTAQILHKTN